MKITLIMEIPRVKDKEYFNMFPTSECTILYIKISKGTDDI